MTLVDNRIINVIDGGRGRGRGGGLTVEGPKSYFIYFNRA